MRVILSAICGSVLFLSPATGGEKPDADALKNQLIELETQSWIAWKNHDGPFFERFLSDDHVEIQPGGRATKSNVVADVASQACTVKDYAITNFALTQFSPTTALLTYRAEQHTVCGTASVPSPVWASSLFVFRDGKWVNALYVHTPAN